MDTFGVTTSGPAGPQSPIKDSMRADYVEPLKDPREKFKQTSTRLSYPRYLDVYLGRCDGYSYSSFDRLEKTRIKGYVKPVGPTDMHKRPVCTSMDLGWFVADPALAGPCGAWTRNPVRYPIIGSEMSKFTDVMCATNPMFTSSNPL